MKGFVEKLIKHFKTHEYCSEWIAVGDVITIIYRLAEEYNNYNDFCEWEIKSWGLFPIMTSCENTLDTNYDYKFCPYCGKKIKVIK